MFPVAGLEYKLSDYYKIDLSIANQDLQNLDNQHGITSYIKSKITDLNKRIAYGGYKEERNFYLKSSLFSDSGRTIHLGIDIWLPVGAAVFAPLNGVIHSKKYNDKDLDYGYTVILEHNLDNKRMHTLYGHLGKKAFDNKEIGQTIEEGEIVGYIGDIHENGSWAPHLHFQIINDLEEWKGDYPGVCHKSESEIYFNNCPDPTYLVLPRKNSTLS